jgi:hypothetical protein
VVALFKPKGMTRYAKVRQGVVNAVCTDQMGEFEFDYNQRNHP